MFLSSFIGLLFVHLYVKQSVFCHLYILIFLSSYSPLRPSVSLRGPCIPLLYSFHPFFCSYVFFSSPDSLLSQCGSQILFVVTYGYSRSTCDQNNLTLKDGCSPDGWKNDGSIEVTVKLNCNDTLVRPQYVHWWISISNLCLHWTAVLSYPILSSHFLPLLSYPLIFHISVISES